ncbi:MAG: hypothetical protein U5K69_30140 [Balneolaceae bacterium]|nr:hypothetical protein [Balneolaceae bacterium]
MPRRQNAGLPSISTVFAGGIGANQAFANATINELLNRNPERIASKEINTLAHMIFLNEGDGFSGHPLSCGNAVFGRLLCRRG